MRRFLLFIFVFFSQIFKSQSNQDVLVLFDNSIRIDSALNTWFQPNDFSCLIVETTTSETNSQSNIVYSCTNGFYGAECNVTSNICEITSPCRNNGTCSLDVSKSLGYRCQCPMGFSGDDCQSDDRICTTNTCWNNGTCIETNSTFECRCSRGYDGLYCESYSDMCANVTCQNYGVCQSTYLSWYCQCLDSSLYSGTYCEQTSSELKTKKALSLSFALVAIIALCVVGIFVVTMDILKYVFNIDPVDRERHRLEKEKEKEEQKRFRKRPKSNKPPMKFFYIYTHA